MELLITGAVALLGYGMSGREQRPRRRERAPALPASAEYPGEENDTRRFDRDHERRAAQRWAQARDPAVTGIVTPNMAPPTGDAPLPFFTSAKAQHTSDAVKQTLLESFTGANGLGGSQTGTYRNKREVEAMFSPSYTAAAVTSSGSAGNGMVEQPKARFQAGTVQNNVRPAEQLTVGRGVGVGADVAASGGFHPMYRVMMGNVNEYRKNNLPGGMIPGADPKAGTVIAGATTVKEHRAPLVYDQERRPMMGTMASVHGHRVYPKEPQDPLTAPRPVVENRFGTPGYAAGQLPGMAYQANETRSGYDRGDNPDRNWVLPKINVANARDGVGGFTYSLHELKEQRRPGTQVGCTGGHVRGPTARMARNAKVARVPQRATTNAQVLGGASVARSGMLPRAFDKPTAPLRSTIAERPAELTNAVSAVQGGTMINVHRATDLSRATARATQHREHFPGMGRVNVHDPNAAGAMATARRGGVTPPSAAVQPSLPNLAASLEVGRLTTTFNKLPTTNPRLDLGMAAQQLQSNPYAQPLWNA